MAAPELPAERARIEARARVELGDYGQALELIADDTSREARLLRADIYWSGERWEDAALALEAVLGPRWEDETPLTDSERHLVMRTAVSLVLAGDETGTGCWRELYLPAMASTVDAAAFDVLTFQVDPSTVAFRQVAQRVAQLDSLDAFRETYLNRIRAETSAAIN